MDDLLFYQKLLAYIEEMEVDRDAEYGFCRDLQELIAANIMPDIYKEVQTRLVNINRVVTHD